MTGGVSDVSVEPSGLVHTMLIFIEASTAGLSSTMQVRMGEDPDSMGSGVSETSLTIGSGTMHMQ